MTEKNNVARTCVKQTPKLFKHVDWMSGTINLDIGGGKYDLGTEFLATKGVENRILDPYNRPLEHNTSIWTLTLSNPVDTVTLSNVLNVIENSEIRRDLLETAYQGLKIGGRIYISCYEGNKSGIGARTSIGTYQLNRKISDYLDEVRQVFPNARREKFYIVAEKEV